MKRTTPLYYESHITIDPVFGELRDKAVVFGEQHGFRMAKLVMRKNLNDGEHDSTDDSFMTGHSVNLDDIRYRTVAAIGSLRRAGFHVRRYKIEETVCDSRYSDELNVLSGSLDSPATPR